MKLPYIPYIGSAVQSIPPKIELLQEIACNLISTIAQSSVGKLNQSHKQKKVKQCTNVPQVELF